MRSRGPGVLGEVVTGTLRLLQSLGLDLSVGITQEWTGSEKRNREFGGKILNMEV
jgi:hypothetical protein